jgi:hypothetical protein
MRSDEIASLKKIDIPSAMEINMETLSAIALGIGLSASTGFRVFIPLLVAGLASHFGILTLGESFVWMGSVKRHLIAICMKITVAYSVSCVSC